MSDFKIVTCCNRIPQEPYYCLEEWFKSLHGHTPLVLTEQFCGKWDGLGSKPKWLYKAITERLIDTEFIIFCDSWDLVFAVDPQKIIDDYKKDETFPIIFSAEKTCFPNDLQKEYDELNHYGEYKYLNSGMIIGRTKDVLTMLEAMDLPDVPDDYRKEDGSMFHVNDQFLYQQIFLKQPVKMELDYGQIFCNTLHSVMIEELEFIDGLGISNKETGTYPYIFHLNGSAKTDGLRNPILKFLNLI